MQILKRMLSESSLFVSLVLAFIFVAYAPNAVAGPGICYNPTTYAQVKACNNAREAETATANASAAANNAPYKDMLGDSTSQPDYNSLLNIVTTILKSGNAMAGNFIPYAMNITELLGAIAFVWLGIMIMLSQADIWHMGLRPLFTLIFTVGFAMYLLWAYQAVTTAVVDGFVDAGNILVGGSGAGNAFLVVMNHFGDDFSTMIELMTKTANKAVSGDWFGAVLVNFIENMPNMLIDFIVIGVTILVFGILMALFVIIYLLYQIVVGIAVAVGPVFIPFLVLPVTRSLFEGWVKMLVMSGIYLMTSTVIVGLVGSAIDQYASQMTAHLTFNGTGLNLGLAIELIILEVVSILALLKTHEFAQAIGGSVSLGGINVANGIAKLASGGLTGG